MAFFVSLFVKEYTIAREKNLKARQDLARPTSRAIRAGNPEPAIYPSFRRFPVFVDPIVKRMGGCSWKSELASLVFDLHLGSRW